MRGKNLELIDDSEKSPVRREQWYFHYVYAFQFYHVSWRADNSLATEIRRCPPDSPIGYKSVRVRICFTISDYRVENKPVSFSASFRKKNDCVRQNLLNSANSQRIADRINSRTLVCYGKSNKPRSVEQSTAESTCIKMDLQPFCLAAKGKKS